jgi:uncharacterized membrane-anchored protein YjiN (DUF445 family)
MRPKQVIIDGKNYIPQDEALGLELKLQLNRVMNKNLFDYIKRLQKDRKKLIIAIAKHFQDVYNPNETSEANEELWQLLKEFRDEQNASN